jgi:hypothetical protein
MADARGRVEERCGGEDVNSGVDGGDVNGDVRNDDLTTAIPRSSLNTSLRRACASRGTQFSGRIRSSESPSGFVGR